jgi:tRNA-2-methylthio-N6-dimethylallyladenosine synthase
VRRERTAVRGTRAFAELLAELDAIPGLDRIRYTSPHPLFFDADLVDAHRRLRALCPHVHLPVQSGSDRILAAMRRRYDRARYLEIVAELRAAAPEIALTSDLIVGFPGESEADFEQTLDLVRAAAFVDSFSFKYSPRPGTAAADLPEPVDPDEAQRRLVALQALQREQTIAYHRSRVGRDTQILVEGESRKGDGQLCGRDPQHRVVNLVGDAGPADEGADRAPSPPLPGTLLRVSIVEATPHSLIGVPRAGAPAGAPLDPAFSASPLKPTPGSADELGRAAAGSSSEEAAALRIVR